MPHILQIKSKNGSSKDDTFTTKKDTEAAPFTYCRVNIFALVKLKKVDQKSNFMLPFSPVSWAVQCTLTPVHLMPIPSS